MMKENAFIIVISCRVSYIQAQQNYFKAKNIKTNYLTSNTSKKQKMAIEKDIISEKSNFKILFITPYQYESGYFKTILNKINKHRLFYIVIDQADNIIARQENLRRQYQNLDLKIIRVPVIAISATTDLEAQKDIIEKFDLLNPKIYAMPVFRSNLYYDTWYINTLPDPLVHLIKFIQNCFSSHNDNSAEKESWGLIICKDLEATISIAKYLTSVGIPTIPYFSRKKYKHLKNVKDVKVITVCDEVNMLTVTNNLVQLIASKSVRFVVYWYVLPSIKKYYSQSSQARYFYGMSYCRIYCQLEDLIHNCTPSSCLNYECCIKNSLVQLQCRHKVYSEYWGDLFSACENYCDICKEKEEVEQKIRLLLQITDDESFKKKLEESLLDLSNNSIIICDKNIQYKCVKDTVSSEYQTKSIVKDPTKTTNNDHISLDTNIQYNQENNDEVYKKSQALLALDEIYKKLFLTQQSTQTITLAAMHCDNIKTIESRNFNKSKKSSKTDYETKTMVTEVITIDDESIEKEECYVHNSQLEKEVSNSDDDIIFIKELRKRRRSLTRDLSLERKKRRK
ncbi:ATP-dependent DNA helicase Q5-like isoform X2 [Phymastichus coffea]|nr:ATP-dependent DNA helicase Q5-like isoform X2 [Phymastichus coffea]